MIDMRNSSAKYAHVVKTDARARIVWISTEPNEFYDGYLFTPSKRLIKAAHQKFWNKLIRNKRSTASGSGMGHAKEQKISHSKIVTIF